jgi:Fur family zinc uptake transcriptional regulator
MRKMKIEEAIRIFKNNGYKHTDKREEILRILSLKNRYMSAKDVSEKLKNDFPGMSFDTIYRNLYLFAQLDILETTDIHGEKHFRFKCDTNEHHHHFICLDCGKTKPINTCPMSTVNKEFQNFEVTGHKFEIYGRCPDCNDFVADANQ